MKKRLLSALLCLMLSAIWLFPYTSMTPRYWILAAGVFAAVLFLVLIPQRAVSLGVAAAVSLGMVFYDSRFFAGMAPAVFVTALAFAAGAADPGMPLKKDGFSLTVLFCAAGTLVFSLLSTFISEGAFSFVFDRAFVWLGAACAVSAVLLVKTLRAKPAAGKKRRQPRFPELPAALYILLTLCMLAGVLFSMKQGMNVRVWTYPAFLAAFFAFTTPNPVTRGLFGKAAA